MTSRVALAALLALATACAPRVVVRPPSAAEFVPPTAPATASPEERERLASAWRAVQAGDVKRAEKEYRRLLQQRPGLVPAETGLAYARLRAGDLEGAGARFEAVLARQADYVPALVGAGAVRAQRGDPAAALQVYQQAVALDPGASAVVARLAELKLQVTERRVGAARASLAAGRREEAIAEYRAALAAAPEVAGVRVELANVLAEGGDAAGAIALLRGDPTEDRAALLRLGEMLGARGDYPGALEAYQKVLAREPGHEEALRRAAETRRLIEQFRMPPEFQAIARAARITRAELAALLSVKVHALSRLAPGKPSVAVDISGSWAREHILKVLGLKLMDVYPNHTFQPGATVRRGDLARAVQQVLDLLKVPAAPAPALADMSRSNLLYYPAARAVAAGLMDVTPGGAFEPWRPVSGEEATRVIEALARKVG